MLKYILKRIVLFIPIFLLVSMIAFGLSKLTPGDPAAPDSRSDLPSSVVDLEYKKRAYRQKAEQLGLDKPPFYFQITTAAYPDTLYRIMPKMRRVALKKLCAQYGNWKAIDYYYHQLLAMERAIASVPLGMNKTDDYIAVRNNTQALFIAYKNTKIESRLADLKVGLFNTPPNDSTQVLSDLLASHFSTLENSYQEIKTTAKPSNNYIPSLNWYGTNNQYHHWIGNFLKGDFGLSSIDFRPVSDKIFEAAKWTLIINLCAIFIAYLVSIPLGVWSAKKRGSKADKRISLLLFLLYSIPSFWIATLLIAFITTPQYGMDLFPSFGIGNSSIEDEGVWTVFWERAYHLILPVFCTTYAALAFVTRQVRGSMVDVLQQDYIRTAKAKGLSERRVIWKHAFRNALFPLITLFGSILPSLIAGAVILEIIFNINGMGSLMLNSIFAQDWPVVYAVLMIGAVLTMLGILIADILYALADPRIQLRD